MHGTEICHTSQTINDNDVCCLMHDASSIGLKGYITPWPWSSNLNVGPHAHRSLINNNNNNNNPRTIFIVLS